MATQIRKPTLFDVSRLALVGSIWGGSFLFIALALESFGPITVATARIATAALVLLGVCAVLKQSLPNRLSDWRKLFVVGIFNSAIPFFLISWGQQFISSAEAALLMATGTFCALIISHFSTTDERINPARVVGVSVGFLGVFVLVILDLIQFGLGSLKGQIAVILAGSSYALSSVLARRISHLPSISTSAGIMLTASGYLIPVAFLLETPFNPDASTISLLSLGFLGIIATAFAFVVRFTIIRDNGAVFMAQVGYLVPLFGVIWSWIFFSEAITLGTWLALILILIGIAITRRGVK